MIKSRPLVDILVPVPVRRNSESVPQKQTLLPEEPDEELTEMVALKQEAFLGLIAKRESLSTLKDFAKGPKKQWWDDLTLR